MLGRNLILKIANINLLQNASRPIILERKFQRGWPVYHPKAGWEGGVDTGLLLKKWLLMILLCH